MGHRVAAESHFWGDNNKGLKQQHSNLLQDVLSAQSQAYMPLHVEPKNISPPSTIQG